MPVDMGTTPYAPEREHEADMSQFSPALRSGLLAGAVSLALILGALGFQYIGGYPPCEMCHWQRWPHFASILVGLGGGALILFGALPARFAVPVALAAVAALFLTGAIGVFHSGVEWGWWEGPTACSGLGFNPAALDNPDAFRVVRCDVAAWRLAGISMAGYNALISFGAAGLCAAILTRRR